MKNICITMDKLNIQEGVFPKKPAWIDKILYHGGVLTLLDEHGERRGVITHAKITGDIFIGSFLCSKFKDITQKDSLSDEIVSLIAASLALREKWNLARKQPFDEIMKIFKEEVLVDVTVFDMVLCAGLLGGGVLHVKGTLRQVPPL